MAAGPVTGRRGRELASSPGGPGWYPRLTWNRRDAWVASTPLAVATSLNNLGGLLKVRGKYEQAKIAHQRAMELHQALLGRGYVESGEGHEADLAEVEVWLARHRVGR